MTAVSLDLADDMYYLTHDPAKGTRLLHRPWVGLALAGCLLGELLLSGWVQIDPEFGVVTLVDARPVAPADFLSQSDRDGRRPLDRAVWDKMAGERWRHTVATWLAVLAESAEVDVRDRMTAAGRLRPGSRSAAPYTAVTWSEAGWPAARLRGNVSAARDVPISDWFLLAMTDAVQLTGRLFDGVEPHVRDRHAQVLAWFADNWPAYATLARVTSTVVAGAVATRH